MFFMNEHSLSSNKDLIQICSKQEILPDNFRQHNYVNTITRYQLIVSINGGVVIYSSSDLHPDIDHVTFFYRPDFLFSNLFMDENNLKHV